MIHFLKENQLKTKENFKKMYGGGFESPKSIRHKFWLKKQYDSIKEDYIELDENIKGESLNL